MTWNAHRVLLRNLRQMKTVIKRTLSGALFIAITVGAILAGAKFSLPLFALYALFTLSEFYRIVWHGEKRPRFLEITGLVASLLFYAGSALLAYDFEDLAYELHLVGLIPIIVGAILLFFVDGLYVVLSRRANPFLDWGKTILGVFYIMLPFALVPQLVLSQAHQPLSFWYLLLPLVLTWVNDTGAYCVGVPFGRHRLIERVSPGKSVEGFVGGLFFSAGVGALLFWLLGWLSPLFGVVFGLAIAGVGVLGDLVESRLKRAVGIKDSGTFLPGHGGFLDRFDSLLFALPVAWLLLIV